MSASDYNTFSSDFQLNNCALGATGAALQDAASREPGGEDWVSSSLEKLQEDLDWYIRPVDRLFEPDVFCGGLGEFPVLRSKDDPVFDHVMYDFLRGLHLRKQAGLSTVQFSPSSSIISKVDEQTGEVVESRYLSFRESEHGPIATALCPEAVDTPVEDSPRMVWRDGGNLVKVDLRGVRPKVNRKGDPLIVAPPVEDRIKLDRGGNCTSPSPVFSRSSRRRFMRQLASVQVDASPVFATLTYPDHFPDDPKVWHRHLDTFAKRFLRKFGAGFAWKLEPKRRKSGENEGKIAPHYHLLIWGCSFVELRNWIPQNWYEVVGSGDEKHLRAGTRVERVRSVRGVMWYASKYMAKVEKEDLGDLPNIGRLWGFKNRKLIPWADELEIALTERSAIKLMRWMRKSAGIPGYRMPSLTIFGDGRQWKRCVEMLC